MSSGQTLAGGFVRYLFPWDMGGIVWAKARRQYRTGVQGFGLGGEKASPVSFLLDIQALLGEQRG